MKLTNSYRIRLSNDDLFLLKELKQLKVKPTTFIRIALREKIKRDLPKILDKESKMKSKIYCPF